LTIKSAIAISPGPSGVSFVDERVTLSNCIVNLCSSVTGASGGGAIGQYLPTSVAASLTITGCSISGCTAFAKGAGVYLRGPSTVVIRNSTIAGNSGTTDGIGIAMVGGGSLLVENSTISGNTSSSSIADGGGIYFNSSTNPSSVIVRNSTISSNTIGGY